MKKLYSTISLMLCALFVFGQKEGSVWYFGDHAGIDFNSGSPVSLSGSAMSTNEGCSSICDTAGNLLFYTDGETIWDATHTPMPNGTGLTGSFTSTQSAIIIKQPGSQYIYYVFSLFNNYCYSIVDMTLHGGLGDVNTSKNVPINSNISSEKQCATHHANGMDVWVVMHSLDTFYAYLLTSAGFTAMPVISTVGLVDNGVAGPMRFSPGGNKLAMGTYSATDTLNVGLLDFDNSSGMFSNSIAIANGGNQCYGVEFSPDGSKLYASDFINTAIYQYNLNAGSTASIIASKVNIATALSGLNSTSMQIGPDKKIYVAIPYEHFLSTIDNPNALGIACNFNNATVPLTTGMCELGLPQIVSDYFNAPTGIENVVNNDVMTLYPNPTANYFYIQQHDLKAHETITIRDMAGRIVFEMEIKSALQKIDIANLQPAVYLVDIKHGDKHTFNKLVRR